MQNEHTSQHLQTSPYWLLPNYKLLPIDIQDQVVRKAVNVNPGLNVNWGIILSSLKMFFTSNVCCSLRLLQLKLKGKQYEQIT